MFRRAIVAGVAAAFLALLGLGCGGSEAQPAVKNSNAPTLKQEPQKTKPQSDG